MDANFDANFVIDTLGGTSAVAKMFDLKPPSVSEWRTEGIPKARLMYLKLARPDVFSVHALPEPEAVQEVA